MNNPDKKQSTEDYLERILMLRKNGKTPVRPIDLAVSFSYSRPSVSIALKKLVSSGFVKIDKTEGIVLTEEGQALAEKVYDKHLTLGQIFTSIGVPPAVAFADACQIEHIISETTFEALRKHFSESKGGAGKRKRS